MGLLVRSFKKKDLSQIDIGGVTLLRAAAKNHKRVTVVSQPTDYHLAEQVLLAAIDDEALLLRRDFALKVGSSSTDHARHVSGV